MQEVEDNDYEEGGESEGEPVEGESNADSVGIDMEKEYEDYGKEETKLD